MAQLYKRHLLRRSRSLNDVWDFVLDPDDRGQTERWQDRFPEQPGRMAVPGCWDTQPENYAYQGVAWYRYRFFLTEGSVCRLYFEGISGGATVWVDGCKTGSHCGTYTPFSCLTKPLLPGDHTLVVRVDNDHRQAKHFPEYPNDWFQYGGIVRDVHLEELKDVLIEQFRVDYQIVQGQIEGQAHLVLRHLGDKASTETVYLQLERETIATVSVTLQPGCSRRMTVPLKRLDIALWSPEHPILHELRAVCAGDDYRLRVGFRSLRLAHRQILLNDKPIRLLGVNRHDEYGDQGLAMSPDLVLRDFELIASLGANAVRCHYPPSELALDLCDAMGLLWWAEIPFYGRWPAVVNRQEYLTAAEHMLHEMIERDHHHPCIFVWSVLNECATETEQGVEAAERMVNFVRRRDSSRPVSYASKQLLNDRGYHLLDCLGINNYPGWYDEGTMPWPELLDRLTGQLDEQGLGHLPLLITETGAGAIYGDRGFESRKWTEGRQAEIVGGALQQLLEDERVAGVFIWQFADGRTADAYWKNRPHTFNNKGLVDRFRRPKDAWWRVHEIFHAIKEHQL